MEMASNFLVEVRNRNFVRVNQIAARFYDFKFTEVFRGIGEWELKLPHDHPLINDITAKGAGIVITETWVGGSRVYSGRVRTFTLIQDASDPNGTWTMTGFDDGIVAQATRAYPDPANLANRQTLAYWKAAGVGETVMKQAVSLNAGPTAIASRKYSWLTTATNLARGAQVTASARFDKLGELLETLGAQANLGWRFYQSGNALVFDVTVPADKSGDIRLDIRNGGLDSSQLGTTAPTATTALVLGQGEGVDRTVVPVTSAAAEAEAVLWGLRWEETKDQRNTDDLEALTNAGSEIVAAGGVTSYSLKIAPSDAPGQRLGIDWGLGDTVAVIINGQETKAIVTKTAVSVSSAGVIKQATVGDPVGYDWEARVGNAITHADQRITQLENYIDAAPAQAYKNLTPNSAVARDYAEVTGDDSWQSPRAYLRNGIVSLSGLVQPVAASGVLFTLPPGYRPDTRAIFAANNSDVMRSIEIETTGVVSLRGAVTVGGYISLASIAYPAAGRATWTTVTAFGASFQQHTTTAYGTVRYWQDEHGLVWLAGLAQANAATVDNTKIFTLPASHTAYKELHIATTKNDEFGGLGTGLAARPGDVNSKLPALATGQWVSLFGVTIITQTAIDDATTAWKFSPADFPMLNGWSQYGTGGFAVVGYGRRADGINLLTGFMTAGTFATIYAGRVFTIPDAFRGKRSLLFSTVANQALARVDLSGGTNGNTAGGIIANKGSNVWFSLDNIKWVSDPT